MFYLINLTDVCKPHMNVSKPSWDRGNKRLRKKLWTAPVLNISLVNKMIVTVDSIVIWYEMGLLERLNDSQTQIHCFVRHMTV